MLVKVGRLKIFIKRNNGKENYVGNLPYSVTDESLKDLFSEAGEVASASIIIDKFSKRSKGFGFVEMSTEEGAQKAKDAFNGKEHEGRKLIVDEARPMKENNFRGE
jgi:RNA recognition motif-containing protein